MKKVFLLLKDFVIISIIFLLLLLIFIFIRKRLNKKAKIPFWYYCFFGVVSLILYFFLYKSVFINSIFVVTKDKTDEKIYYYEVNDREYKRKTKKFNYEENEVYYFEGCFQSYIDRPSNKVLNTRLDGCTIIDKENNEVTIDSTLDKIIDLVSNLEHDIFRAKIIKVDNDYYIVVELNVNWHSPYDLYKYKNDRLSYIYTFESEDVIAIKEKE